MRHLAQEGLAGSGQVAEFCKFLCKHHRPFFFFPPMFFLHAIYSPTVGLACNSDACVDTNGTYLPLHAPALFMTHVRGVFNKAATLLPPNKGASIGNLKDV